MVRNDPLRNFRFRLEIDNLAIAGFSEVAIAETLIEAIDYREGKLLTAKLNGTAIPTDMRLRSASV